MNAWPCVQHPSAKAGRALSTVSSFAAHYRDLNAEPDVAVPEEVAENGESTVLSFRTALREPLRTVKAMAHCAPLA